MEALDGESRRAWTEAMAVRPFGDDYLVESEAGGTHYVSLDERSCSCADQGGDRRCKHIRRVAIEINLGRLPAPAGQQTSCDACGADLERPATADPPHLCADCAVEVGDVVVDREGDPATPLLVVSHVGYRADRVAIPSADCTVAEYPGNGSYDPDDPVVEVIYPDSITPGEPPQRYRFPVTRLTSPPDREDRQATLPETVPGWRTL